jgi:hypothetical protein
MNIAHLYKPRGAGAVLSENVFPDRLSGDCELTSADRHPRLLHLRPAHPRRAGRRGARAKNRIARRVRCRRGYLDNWGHLIEQRVGEVVLWRVVPVALWSCVSELRRGSRLTIPELVSPIVRPAVQPHLPDGVLITGCQAAGRRSPHALFTLLLAARSARKLYGGGL